MNDTKRNLKQDNILIYCDENNITYINHWMYFIKELLNSQNNKLACKNNKSKELFLKLTGEEALDINLVSGKLFDIIINFTNDDKFISDFKTKITYYNPLEKKYREFKNEFKNDKYNFYITPYSLDNELFLHKESDRDKDIIFKQIYIAPNFLTQTQKINILDNNVELIRDNVPYSGDKNLEEILKEGIIPFSSAFCISCYDQIQLLLSHTNLQITFSNTIFQPLKEILNEKQLNFYENKSIRNMFMKFQRSKNKIIKVNHHFDLLLYIALKFNSHKRIKLDYNRIPIIQNKNNSFLVDDDCSLTNYLILLYHEIDSSYKKSIGKYLMLIIFVNNPRTFKDLIESNIPIFDLFVDLGSDLNDLSLLLNIEKSELTGIFVLLMYKLATEFRFYKDEIHNISPDLINDLINYLKPKDINDESFSNILLIASDKDFNDLFSLSLKRLKDTYINNYIALSALKLCITGKVESAMLLLNSIDNSKNILFKNKFIFTLRTISFFSDFKLPKFITKYLQNNKISGDDQEYNNYPFNYLSPRFRDCLSNSINFNYQNYRNFLIDIRSEFNSEHYEMY